MSDIGTDVLTFLKLLVDRADHFFAGRGSDENPRAESSQGENPQGRAKRYFCKEDP